MLICLINFMNLYGSFMNSYKYNHKKFMIYCGLVVNYFGFVMNGYSHYYGLVLNSCGYNHKYFMKICDYV